MALSDPAAHLAAAAGQGSGLRSAAGPRPGRAPGRLTTLRALAANGLAG
jgi:hypothetical protein